MTFRVLENSVRGAWWRGAALVLLLSVFASPAPGAGAKVPNRRVLLIGIDGCRFDAIERANTPHLDQLMASGCYDTDTQILGTRYTGNNTISGPGWSSILTGVWADKHGVNDNEFTGKNYREYPHFFSRLKTVYPQAFTASIVTWFPIQQHIVSAADEGRAVPAIGEDKSVAYAKADAIAAKETTRLLQEKDPTAVFFYIGQVDETGHKVGFHPSVTEYVEAIERADGHVGEVLAALRSRPNVAAEDWLVLVTSDHGGKGTGHGDGHKEPEILNSFMIVSGPAAQHGKLDEVTYLVDVPVTALTHLGVALDPAWKLDGRPVGLKDR